MHIKHNRIGYIERSFENNYLNLTHVALERNILCNSAQFLVMSPGGVKKEVYNGS